MMPIPPFLIKWGLIALAALAIVAGAALWFHEHDARIRSEDAARVAAATAAEQIRQAVAGAAAVSAEAQAAVARAEAANTVKMEIARAPTTVACAASVPVRVALDSMRRAGAGSSATSHPLGIAGVPTTTGAAQPRPK